MIPFQHFALTAALAALASCAGSLTSSEPAVDLSNKAKVVSFDVSGMT
jgi:hypothetical protein